MAEPEKERGSQWLGKRQMLLGSLTQSTYSCHLDPYRLRPRNIGMHIGPIHEHWDDTQLPCLSGYVRASTLVLETPTSITKLEIQGSSTRLKVHIVLSHVQLVGKGLDSAVP